MLVRRRLDQSRAKIALQALTVADENLLGSGAASAERKLLLILTTVLALLPVVLAYDFVILLLASLHARTIRLKTS
jgi:hypothetical protein